ncbi:OmpA family protein [Chryseolinea lacunae]|uniref:OmpA family protein n=1 Tax=Chryseolinea lacunae TaxID=2801331 RepID=A0ABS1L0Z1_9BACT|nr:OmpA family protein [Chryseolinea lacunae]MBL0745123.1 OmpA family protein [Chryseolinea lacunae]
MENKIKTFVAALMMFVVVLATQFFVGCQASNTTKGGAIGAGVGGAIGGVIGHQSDNTVVGAIIGAAVGGTAGALIGRHMDKQAEELKNDLKGARVQRVGEGILITFDSGLLFDVNSAGLQPATKANLTELAKTLNKYDDTNILIEGHTDSSGEDAYNQTLSEKRANSVEAFLGEQGVSTGRVTTKGYGEKQPLQGNDTDAGRQANRRVEVAIYANKEMKKLAKNGQLGE